MRTALITLAAFLTSALIVGVGVYIRKAKKKKEFEPMNNEQDQSHNLFT